MISKIPPKNFNKKFDVVSAFIEHDGEILLLHRQDHKPQGNTWGVPAGKVNSNENMLDALVREVAEEIGLLTDRENYVFFEKYYVRYSEYDFIYHVYHLIVKEKPTLTINLKEHKNHQWVKPADALKLNLIQDEDMCIKWMYSLKP
jgi:8-oxo-dGTP pyrophosphatase MutT (NUDIX family)